MIHPRLSRLLQPPPARRQVITIIISYFENHKQRPFKMPSTQLSGLPTNSWHLFPPCHPNTCRGEKLTIIWPQFSVEFQNLFSQTPLLAAALCLALLAAVMGLACARYCGSACINRILLWGLQVKNFLMGRKKLKSKMRTHFIAFVDSKDVFTR